jgi:catechol 2,3-dioxygenase-like lactoylglutathione lyase family enzyme
MQEERMTQPPAIRFQRSNLVVRNLDRALAIYRDVLGFTVDFIQDSPVDSYSYPVFRFPRAARLRFAALSAGPSQVRTLALTEVTGITLPAAPTPSLHALVLECPPLDAVLRALATIPDVQIMPEERLRTHDGRLGREVAFMDPDGHVVVLYRMDAAA